MRNDQHYHQPHWQKLLPEFAPLPHSFVEYLFTHPERFDLSAFSYDPDASLFDRVWANIQMMRGNVFGYVLSVVLAERSGALDTRLSISWFHKAMKGFDPLHEESSRATFTNWQTRGLLRTQEFGVPEPNSASSLLMMRSLSSQRRSWLPRSMDSHEPWFWVWGKGPTDETPQVYQIPLQADLPPHTLLWTSWGGAAWLPGWKSVRQVGAIAWAGTMPFRGQTLWHLSAEELAAWDHGFVENAQLGIQPHTALPGLHMAYGVNNESYRLARLNTLADELLSRVGEPLLYQHLERYYSRRLPPNALVPSEQSSLDPCTK
ncbi:MAG: hypothetical protein ABI234_10510 [Ktedonobacteraceae bacterium]